MSDSCSRIPKEQLISYHKVYLDYPPIRDESTKTTHVPLFNNGEIVNWTIIDTSHESIVLPHSFYPKVNENIRKENTYYACVDNKMLHHIIKGKPGYDRVVDHINRQSLDNTRENLHFVTRSQNTQNQAKREGCKSDYKGLKLTANGSVQVRIVNKDKKVRESLGTFKDHLHAATVFDCYAIKYNGINAGTNNLLTHEMKKWILANGIPEEYQKKEPVERSLPKNIYKRSGGYKVVVERETKVILDTFVSTLPEAIKVRDNFISNYELETKRKEDERLKEPTKNSEGQCVIKIRHLGEIIDILVDEHVWMEISKYTWAINGGDYCTSTIDGKMVYMHKYIYANFVPDAIIQDGESIDHIRSKSKFDNRIQNLRPASASLQSHNRDKSPTADPLNEYKGVDFDGRNFNVRIRVKKIKVSYGSFKIEEDAARRANEVFTILYGKNARLNVIDETKRTTVKDKIEEAFKTKESIQNVKKVLALRGVIFGKELDTGNGGPIKAWGVSKKNLEEIKQKVISILFP